MSCTARPPFGVVPAQTAAAAATDIVAVFDAVARRPDKLQWVQRETNRRFESAVDPAMAAMGRAGRAIARALDADAGAADRPAYHNRQHFCEAMLVACFLGHLHALPPRDAQRLLLAALVHDMGHDGRATAGFETERLSLAHASPFLRDAGVDADERRRLAAMVLATQPVMGTRIALHAAAGKLPAGRPADPHAPELDALFDDAPLARLAVLLCEADLLPSAGLTEAHGRALQRRLAAEWQRPLDDHDKRRFLDTLLSDGVIGAFFQPNVVACRARLGTLDDGPARR